MAKNDKQLKIFVDCHVFDGSLQGTTTYLKGLYSELVKDTTKHFFFAASNINAITPLFGNAQNITYLQYTSYNKWYRLLINIPALIKKHKIDYAHFQYVVPPFKYCKYINTIHDVLFMDYPEYFPLGYRIKNRLLFQLSAKRSDIVVTVSEYSKQRLIKHFGLKNSIITPNAIDPAFYESYNRQEVKATVEQKYKIDRYWLFVSRWEPRKNHHRLLKVFADNQYYREYYLVLVGEKAIPNPAFTTLYNSLDKAIKEKVLLLNKVDFNDLLLLVRGAAVAVYPSVAEGFGIPPLEAAAAGVPSASSGTSAMSDFDFLGNMLFNPLSEEDMHQKIMTGLKGENYPKPTHEMLYARYNWKKAAQTLSDVLV